MRECGFDDLTVSQQELVRAAEQARKHAYSPYSNHRVGAAVRSPSGRVFSACNVEIASLSQTVHAERLAVLSMAASGERRVVELACFGQFSGIPCAECRQAIWEFCGADRSVEIICTGVDQPVRVLTMGELYPHAYGPETKQINPEEF